MLPLGHNELDTKADDIGNNNLGQHGQQAEAEHFPKRAVHSGRRIVLVTNVIHAEQKRRHQRDNHKYHDALAVNRIMHVHSRLRRGIGHEQERLEPFEHRAESVKLAPFLKRRLYLIQIFS